MFAFKKPIILNYYCLFNALPAPKISRDFIFKLIDYFKTHHYELASFFGWDAKYVNSEGNLEYLSRTNFADLSFISLRAENISINLSSGSPNLLYVEMPEGSQFDFTEFIKFVNEYFPVEYGYTYKGLKGRRTEAYLFGQREDVKSLKGVGRTSIDNFKDWLKHRMAFKDGKMRDIYQVNVLNPSHLNNICKNGQTLKEIIGAGPTLGKIEMITADVYLWSIDEDHLWTVRKQLYEEPFII